MTQQMTPEELAESVKRLRDIYACHNDADAHELMFAVNALVDLVGEIRETICLAGNILFAEKVSVEFMEEILAKSAPIAALAKEEA